MVVNATEAPTQAEVLFLVEVTAANGLYISELKTNYIIPTLEYFHGGPLEEGGGNGSVYGVVGYKTADCHPDSPVSTFGPFTDPQKVVETIDKLQFIGGRAENKACVCEALNTALTCFEEMGRAELPKHALLICCLPPYSAYAGGIAPAGTATTIEAAARLCGERGVQVSLISGRRAPALMPLYELSGSEMVPAHQRNYAKDPRHLVLLRGYSLKERPPSPAPPPAPEIQTEMFGPRVVSNPPRAAFPRGAAPAPPAPPAPAPRAAWLAPPRHALYANNSALLTQLAQPSYPPPTPSSSMQQPGLQRMPGMSPAGPSVPGGSGQPPQRTYIWSGVLEWMEKGKNPGDQQKTTKLLPCQVSANSKDMEPELKVDTWPNKLLMQLMPKQLISNIGGQYLKDSKSVLFHLQHNEALDALTKVMVNGFAGCVHFSPMSSPPQCDIKVLILLYTPDKNAYLGFIPNNQATFVERLKKVIQQQKITQIINKQIPGGVNPGNSIQGGPMPSGVGSPSGMGGGGMGGSGMGGSGMQQPIIPPQQMQHPQQGMMVGGVQPNQQGGKGRSVSQLDGLEAARQQNLEKIQQLQQTLEAAHQQEAQFKSQMDIMTHLHAAQQQEQHYKQLEEQQRKQQLQQQLAAQLRGGGVGGVAGVGVGGVGGPRLMRPMMPANPGLRHLLQQQPQYRPGGAAPRPQTQQYDDVPNYSDFL